MLRVFIMMLKTYRELKRKAGREASRLRDVLSKSRHENDRLRHENKVLREKLVKFESVVGV